MFFFIYFNEIYNCTCKIQQVNVTLVT
ncbi:unnamed protein product [Nezara viridula]|uniref:Uncharacterized protein n=1 Tax=Nezara viridula TaxID=85310 RepID=A0A9P0H4Q5_NEZVI|nr:unnamed protein product [Nezara viridula]